MGALLGPSPSSELHKEAAVRTATIPTLTADCLSWRLSPGPLGCWASHHPTLDFRLSVHKERAHFLSTKSMWLQSPHPVQSSAEPFVDSNEHPKG